MIIAENHWFIFKDQVEKEACCGIKALMRDRGSEFLLKEFMNFCQVHGIESM